MGGRQRLLWGFGVSLDSLVDFFRIRGMTQDGTAHLPSCRPNGGGPREDFRLQGRAGLLGDGDREEYELSDYELQPPCCT